MPGIAPEWIVAKLLASGIGNEELPALIDRAPLDIRINRLKPALYEIDGASPVALLEATARSLRAGRRARDEEAAERLAVRLVLPLGACHLPAFVILGIAPVVASVGMGMLTG